MSTATKLAFGIGASLLVTLVACGGGGDSISQFNRGEDREDGFGNGSSPGESGLGGDNGNGNKENPDLAKCATQSATAEARPVYLVFMFDKSGSMSQSSKWTSSKAATRAFFESPQSAGISATLTFFPSGSSCNTSDYNAPQVALTKLPSASFGTALDSQSPNGGTPTRPALEGAINTAQTVAAGPGKDGKVAIVLVTDGQPEGCSNNNVNSIRDLASSVASTIPTYVIGVGDALTNLNAIAVGGGTKNALIVSTADPTKIQTEFSKAIETIKASAIACDYNIPPPPAGQAFDRAKVNVQHVPQGGTAGTLDYNPSCTGGTGWRYDNEATPTRILLCDGSCDSVKSKAGKVDIVFGCATQTGPVK
ncbi:MAG: VWA domain-containing protein [Labilithrix sp.]|nr:VWA domain-containing protein [Labilithrix sp.]